MMAAPFNFRWTTSGHDNLTDATFLQVDWAALLQVCREKSGDPTCVYQGDDYHAGGRHIVRRIELKQSGELWLARIPKLQRDSDEQWPPEVLFIMESEIATMQHVASNTEIPVPKVYAHSCTVKNDVKAPFLLMQCIRGNMLYDLGGQSVLDAKKRLQMCKTLAWVQCQLASAPLPRLGCPILGADGRVEVGKMLAPFGFEGPFDSTLEYFLAWCRHNETFKNLHKLQDPVIIRSAQNFPRRLKSVIESLLPPGYPESGYPVVHPDLGVHNLLFNDGYDIVGVIDWEYAFSAPMDVFAARTNVYARFESKNMALGWGEGDGITEGLRYLAEVRACEEQMGLSLSTKFGSILGDIGYFMNRFEEGNAGNLDLLLDRAESELYNKVDSEEVTASP